MIPVFVCSYRRPDAIFLKRSVEYKFPLYVFVREEEYNDYCWLKERKNTRVIKIKKKVKDLGETREVMVNYAIAHDINKVFIIDDDISRLDITVWDHSRNISRASGTVKAERENWDYVLSEWENVWKENEDIAILGASYRPFAWGQMKNPDSIYLSHWGQVQQAVGVNIDFLRDNSINYHSNSLSGPEDLSLQYEVILKGGQTLVSNRIQYDAPKMGVGKGGCQVPNFEKELLKRIDLFCSYYKNIGLYRVGCTIKSKVPSIKFNWSKIKERYNEQKYL